MERLNSKSIENWLPKRELLEYHRCSLCPASCLPFYSSFIQQQAKAQKRQGQTSKRVSQDSSNSFSSFASSNVKVQERKFVSGKPATERSSSIVKEAAPWQQTVNKGIVRTRSDSSNRSKVDKGMESRNHRSKHAHSVANGNNNLSDSGRKEGSNNNNYSNNNNRSSRESNNIKGSLTKKNSTDNSSSSAAAPSSHGYESPLYASPQSERVKPLRERQMQPLPHFGDILPPPVEFSQSSGKGSLFLFSWRQNCSNSWSPQWVLRDPFSHLQAGGISKQYEDGIRGWNVNARDTGCQK